MADEGQADLGELAQIGLPDRTEQVDVRRHARVEGPAVRVGDLGPDPGDTDGEARRPYDHGRPDELRGRGLPVPHAVRAQQQGLEGGLPVGPDRLGLDRSRRRC